MGRKKIIPEIVSDITFVKLYKFTSGYVGNGIKAQKDDILELTDEQLKLVVKKCYEVT